MDESSSLASVSQGGHASRVRVQVRADAFIYEGFVHLTEETRRLQEVLNDPRPFLNLTDVVIHDTQSATTNRSSYLALNKGAITHVVVLSSEPSRPRRREQRAAAPSAHSTSGSVAGGPTVPPAGPRTLPGPVPSGAVARSGRQTQPYPHLEEEVSDLILDDDLGSAALEPSTILGRGLSGE